MKKIVLTICLLLLSVSLFSCANTEDTPNDEHDGITFESIIVLYDGEAHSIYVSNLPEGYYVFYTGNAVSEIGVHAVSAKVYNPSLDVSFSLTATITIMENPDFGKPSLNDIVFEDIKIPYDGEEHSVEVLGLPEGYTVEYTGNNVKEVGTYTVTAKIYDSAHTFVRELTATITIVEKADVELPLV